MPALLYLFSLTNLVIGSGAFLIGGVLQQVSDSLGVSVAAAGQAMTAYAMATALLAPLLLVATGHWSRRSAAVLGLVLFAAGNAVCALAPGLTTLLAGRALMGLGAVFTPLSAGVAVVLVEPARRGQALALVFLGIGLSYAVGIPLGAWLTLHFGWRWPVAGIGVAALLMAGLVAWRMPRRLDAPGASFAGLVPLLLLRPVITALSVTLLYFSAIFCVFAYIGPVLQALQPMSGERIALTLALFGVSGSVGTLLGGWANDRYGAHRSMLVQLAVLASSMVLLPFSGGHYALLVAVLLVWGLAGFAMMPAQQSRLAALAPSHAPLLLSLNTSMLYFGTAFGAVIGGLASTRLGFAELGWAGVPFAVAAWLLLYVSGAASPAPEALPAAQAAPAGGGVTRE